MSVEQPCAVHWFRRDLRITDNTGLSAALSSGIPVLPLFIFDDDILSSLQKDDKRVAFIYQKLTEINNQLKRKKSSVALVRGKPLDVWKHLISKFNIKAVYVNKDYEPYALKRDNAVFAYLQHSGIKLHAFKDQVIFEETEIVKKDGNPYTVFTPYKNSWMSKFIHNERQALADKQIPDNPLWLRHAVPFPGLEELGFRAADPGVRPYVLTNLDQYETGRDYPAADATSRLGPHLRFGTVSVRAIIRQISPEHEVFLSELIWREFFMQILYNFPQSVSENFRKKYDSLEWRNNQDDFECWKQGLTGYPLVDAGMRELNATGYMHNRVRMVAAGFLCKHLLIDWRLGEQYFAGKLLDYDMSANCGNWQWAAGTGCDAAPYFRIFNPVTQQKKFDSDFTYIRSWIPEFGAPSYPEPMVDHAFARNHALAAYKSVF